MSIHAIKAVGVGKAQMSRRCRIAHSAGSSGGWRAGDRRWHFRDEQRRRLEGGVTSNEELRITA